MDLFSKCHNFEEAKAVISTGYYPYFVPIEESNDTEVIIRGEKKIMVGSNNYLGLTHHPKVLEAAEKAARKYGSSCTGSRFLNGTLDLHEKLEAEIASFMRKEAALVFTTGFLTNLGVISTLVGKDDIVFIDKLDHASIIDACRLSYGETLRFRHNDIDDLERALSRSDPEKGKLIVVDGIFSMEGDIAKIPQILPLAQKYKSRLMIDDAHSIGVLGKEGAGTAQHFGVGDKVDIVMGTFSKSFASIGGFAAAEESVIHYLKHNARSLIFSASMPPSAIAAVIASLEVIRSEPERRENLWKNARKMQEGIKELGFDIGLCETPIVPIVVGENFKTFMFWKRLFDEGVFTNPVVSPAVPEKSSRLRTSYMASHTDEQLDFVLEKLHKVGKELGVI